MADVRLGEAKRTHTAGSEACQSATLGGRGAKGSPSGVRGSAALLVARTKTTVGSHLSYLLICLFWASGRAMKRPERTWVRSQRI